MLAFRIPLVVESWGRLQGSLGILGVFTVRPVLLEEVLAQGIFGDELGVDGFSREDGEDTELLCVFVHLFAVVEEDVQLLEETHRVEEEGNPDFGVELAGQKQICASVGLAPGLGESSSR